ncbi:MAG: exodeoxyribonuclease III [Rickettsiales bacterium]|jgi:exodeoxyribonuclease-3|nr:exodeoxyribonuclease III [Rickettsiales bacterium]
MKLLTLNINSIRAHAESFIEILNSGAYDVILVQELKVETAAFPHNLFDAHGYNIRVYGQKSWNGVAVFSKYSVEDLVRGLPNFPDANARFIECVIDGRIRIINVYMPNGESEASPKFPYKIEWMKAFSEHIKQYANSEEPVLIGGDFNVALQDCDVWSPENYRGSSISAPAGRAIMREWLDSGWIDCWRELNPDDIGFTWFGYRGFGGSLEKNQGLRLDYWLANDAAKNLIADCQIDRGPRLADKPTDHCGLMLSLREI